MYKLYILGSLELNNFSERFMTDLGRVWTSAYLEYDLDGLEKYAIYHNYQGDYRDNYSFSIGVEKEYTSNIFELKNIKTKLIEVDPEVGVEETWKKIWSLEASGELKRAYIYDIEKYKLDGSVDIYLSIK